MSKLPVPRFCYCALLALLPILVVILWTTSPSTTTLRLRSNHLVGRGLNSGPSDGKTLSDDTSSPVILARASQHDDDGDFDMDDGSNEVTEESSDSGSIASDDSELPAAVPEAIFSYDEYVAKGHTLSLYMHQDVHQLDHEMTARGKRPVGHSTVQSSWNEYKYLDENGWKRIVPDTVNYDAENFAPIKSAITGLGVSSSFGGEHPSNVAVQYVQDRPYTATSAEYSNIYNVKDGVIVAYNNYGPQYQINTNRDLRYEYLEQGIVDILPPSLKQWSDVVWLEYRQQCLDTHRRFRDLRYVFRVEAVAKGTLRVLNTVLGSSPDSERGVTSDGPPVRAPPWSHRKTYREHELEFHAIVGLPNGAGVAWLLITHKAELGLKKIKSVTVFCSDKESGGLATVKGPSLLFELADVSLPPGPARPQSPNYVSSVEGHPGPGTQQKPKYGHHEPGPRSGDH